MVQQLKYLQDYLRNNNLHSTLQSLRSQIMSKYPQNPSNQFMSIVDNVPHKKSAHTMSFTNRSNNKTQSKKKTQKQQLQVQGILGGIAYSPKLLEDNSMNQKLNKLIDNKIFQKTVSLMFPETVQKRSAIEQSFEFKDQLQFAEVSNINNNPMNYQPHNLISHIDIDQQSGSSILSQPSLVLQELNKEESVIDQYTDDKDLGYFQYSFTESQLLNGCAKLTKKYGYPERAVKKNSKDQIKTKKNSTKKKQGNSKFPQNISFPNCPETQYPIEFGGVIYNALKIKVIFDRQKTGYEDSKQIRLQDGGILAGRYRKQGVLGKGVFAQVLKVTDLVKNELTCLKMIVNSNSSKDFFDQALDQIKILTYINANCDPDQKYLIKFKNVFYHREHLFIETDLMKDNLYITYQKNQSFFSLPVIKEIARQILTALKTLHKLQIIHADLKPENILIKSYNPIMIKVIDLGNSCFFHDNLGEYVQSRSYRAPEVVLGVGYDQKIDIWSLGCILAQLWTKNVLFLNDHVPGMLARIQGIVGQWPEWMLDNGQGVQNMFSKQNLIYYEQDNKFHILIPKITSLKDRIRTNDRQFLNFLQSMLRIDPNFRISAEEALMHPFIIND